MCGRFVATAPPEALAEHFHATLDEAMSNPRWNIGPKAAVSTVVEDEDAKRAITKAQWGLIPSWAKEAGIGYKMINARAETITEKPTYKRPFAKRRCIIPADGFYEWVKSESDGKKLPYFIHRADSGILAFAGLYEFWRDPILPEDAPKLRTCTIITTSSNKKLSPIHDRMPVVLNEEDWEQWLSPENNDVDSLKELLVPAPSEMFEAYRVDTAVNTVRNQGDHLADRLTDRVDPVEVEDPAHMNQ